MTKIKNSMTKHSIGLRSYGLWLELSNTGKEISKQPKGVGEKVMNRFK
jgi:hypothetical protein